MPPAKKTRKGKSVRGAGRARQPQKFPAVYVSPAGRNVVTVRTRCDEILYQNRGYKRRRSSSKFGGVLLSTEKTEDTRKLLELASSYANAIRSKLPPDIQLQLDSYKDELERQVRSRTFLIRTRAGEQNNPLSRIQFFFEAFQRQGCAKSSLSDCMPPDIRESLKNYFLAFASHGYGRKAVKKWPVLIRLPPCIGKCVRSVMNPASQALELCNSFKRDLQEKYSDAEVCRLGRARMGTTCRQTILSAFGLQTLQTQPTLDKDMIKAIR